MVSTSSEYKQAIRNNRTIYADVSIALQSGSILEVPQHHLRGLVIEDDVSGTSSFDIGSAIINQCTVKIDNSSGQYSEIEFDQAEITVRIGLQLSETVEWIPKGIYTADPGEESGSVITVKGYDHMRKFDFPYTESALTYPATLKQIVQDACDKCGVTFLSDSFLESSYIVQTRPSDEALTFRNILCWVGQIACCWFKCNSNGALVSGFYDTEALENDTSEKFHDIKNLSAFTKSTEDIVITGVKVIQESEDGQSVAYQSGSDGYVLSVEKNELIGDSDGQTIASSLGERLIGLRFRKLSVSHQSDPSIEAGDLAKVTDRKGNVYKTLLTSTAFQLGGLQKSACNAETPARKSAQRYSESTKTYVALRKLVREEKTARETAVANLATALANSSGLYLTTETQDDGSTIYYAHNKPTLAESDIVWKFTAEAIGISTDGGKSYPYGFTVTGEMIARILQTEGINADWINSGALTVKGTDGTIVFQADMATGKVTINADSISIGGKAVATREYAEQLADQATNLTVLLSNEYQGIPTDYEGNYETFPECVTSIQVLYGSTDITSQCTLTVTESTGITGVLDQTHHKYTVTGLAADSGWVDIKATYLSRIAAAKRFVVSKIRAGDVGPDGKSARVYMLKSSDTVIKRGQDKMALPDEVVFEAYYRDGNEAARTPYCGRFKIETTPDGEHWTEMYLSREDESSCRYGFCPALEDGDGHYIEDGNGNIVVAWNDSESVIIRCTLYASGGKADALDMITVPVVIDVAALTHEQIFNLLTNNGSWQGIYYENGRMYISFTYAKGGQLKLGGVDNERGQLEIYDESGNKIGWINNRGIYFEPTDDNISCFVTRSNITSTNGIKDQNTASLSPRLIDTVSISSDGTSYYTAIRPGNIVSGYRNSTYFALGKTNEFFTKVLITADLEVEGTKNRVVHTDSFGTVKQYCYETASPMFGDVGCGQTDSDGLCYVYFDPIFAETVSSKCEYYVFLQKEGSGDIWVAEKNLEYFSVCGTPGLVFAWEVKAKQREYEYDRMEASGNEPDIQDLDYSASAEIYLNDYEEELYHEKID